MKIDKVNNSIFSKPFLESLFFTQNKWHQHGVFLHTMRVTYYCLKGGDYSFFMAGLLHDIGKPSSAFVDDDEDREFGEYSFTDHEERSYQIIKNWFLGCVLCVSLFCCFLIVPSFDYLDN